MKKIETQLFNKSFAIISIVSLAVLSAGNVEAATQKNPHAKQIGFKVVDQPAVVIDGQAQKNRQQIVQRSTTSAAPSLAAEPAVEGFADKVPLTVALQQILPQGYGYTLGDGVDAGQLVSWRGGRPWGDVLQSMLAPSGLSYSLNGRSVAINDNGMAPTIVMGVPGSQPVAVQPVMQAPPEQVVVQQPVIQQPVMQQPMMQQPVMVQQQVPVMVQQPAPVMMQQPVQQQVVMQQPVVEQPMMMQQPAPVMMQPPMQVAQDGPQPLQIENPLIFVPQTWEAKPGQTLRSLLQEWCSRVGAELHWKAEFDYPIMASVSMTGTFEEAVRTLLSGFDGAKPVPRGRLHYNPAAGQSILVVEAAGNNYGD